MIYLFYVIFNYFAPLPAMAEETKEHKYWKKIYKDTTKLKELEVPYLGTYNSTFFYIDSITKIADKDSTDIILFPRERIIWNIDTINIK